MSKISFRKNDWRNVVEGKCHDCGERVEIKYFQIVGSVGKAWEHTCSGVELEGQEIKA